MTMNMEDFMSMNMMSKGKTGDEHFLITMFLTLFNIMLISAMKPLQEMSKTWFEKMKQKMQQKTQESVQGLVEKKVGVEERSIISCNDKHDKYKVSLRYQKVVKDEKEKETRTKEPINVQYMKALFHKFRKLHHLPSLYLTTDQFVPVDTKVPFEVTDNLICIMHKLEFDQNNDINKCELELYSKHLTSSDIASEMTRLLVEYEDEKQVNLNNNTYIFNISAPSSSAGVSNSPNSLTAVQQAKIDRQDKIRKISGSSPFLTFTRTIFHSNRNPENVFGAAAKKVFDRLNFFQTKKQWYADKGIPYQLGCLLSGAPGTGKTSTIKAVANSLKRHIINVDFSNIHNSKQLYNLFDNEYIDYITDLGQHEKLKIPFSKRLYVLEEIDTLGDIVLDRAFQNSSVEVLSGQITLGDILTILDGNNEYPDRVIIITSNFPERLDRAIIRGGRMDVNVTFGNPTNKEVNDYINFFFDADYQQQVFYKESEEPVLSFADVGQVCFSNDEEIVHDVLHKKIILQRGKGEERKIAIEENQIRQEQQLQEQQRQRQERELQQERERREQEHKKLYL